MPWKEDGKGGRTYYCHVYSDDDMIFWCNGHAGRWLKDLLTAFRPTTEEARTFRFYWLKQIEAAQTGMDREDRR